MWALGHWLGFSTMNLRGSATKVELRLVHVSRLLDVSILDIGMIPAKDVDPDLAVQTCGRSEVLNVSIVVDTTI
jgi:hypothetical protein